MDRRFTAKHKHTHTHPVSHKNGNSKLFTQDNVKQS